jgi:3-methyladenine DNA glycosylase Mpg
MGHWMWDEPEVRRMTEEAGFADVSISYVRSGGDSRLLNLFARSMGAGEARLVRGVKPLADTLAGLPVGETSSLVGSGAS